MSQLPPADATIGFGVLFDENYAFPWQDAEDDLQNIDDWWVYKIHGLEHVLDPRDLAYTQERVEFEQAHPIPVTLVEARAEGSARVMLCVPSSIMRTRWGTPLVIDPAALVVSQFDTDALIEFCKTYGLKYLGQPAWYLSSY